jgi:hypothetical protein
MNKVNVVKPQSLGIKETSEFFDLTDEIIEAIATAKADGKVNVFDIPVFLGVPVKMITAFQGIEKIDDELTDLDPEEVAELEARIDKYAQNPRYANLVGFLMLAANEVVAIVKEKKEKQIAA